VQKTCEGENTMTNKEKQKLIAAYKERKASCQVWWKRYEINKDEVSLRGADQAQGRLEEIQNVMAILKIN